MKTTVHIVDGCFSVLLFPENKLEEGMIANMPKGINTGAECYSTHDGKAIRIDVKERGGQFPAEMETVVSEDGGT